MTNLLVNHPLTDLERRSSIFEGSLLLYSRNAATRALVDHARTMISEAFNDLDPERAQFDLNVADFIARVGPLKSRFTNDERTKELIHSILTTFGCDLDHTFFDVPRLRVVPHGGYLSSGVSYAYKPHRDIWYASPPAQVNWWIPVWSVLPSRSMAFFPAYFEKPLRNTSASFDYGEWCRVGRRLAIAQTNEDTRDHPLAIEPVDTTSELRVAGDAGELIIFSAAHLHATAPNDSGITRFSVDFRTVVDDDLLEGRSAPNVDSAATGTTIGDFLRASDLSALLLGQPATGGAVPNGR